MNTAVFIQRKMRMFFPLFYLHMVTFHRVVTGNILNAYFKNNTNESMFTYYYSVLTTSDRNNLRCLIKCHQIISTTSCIGINVNTVTGECIYFNLLPIVDQTGNYQMTPRSENWISYYKYPGKYLPLPK